MEASNLSGAEFKLLVMRMLKELIGYFNSIKKNQAGIKVTLNEIKKNLQGINSGMMKLRIKSMIWNIRKERKTFIQHSKKKKE